MLKTEKGFYVSDIAMLKAEKGFYESDIVMSKTEKGFYEPAFANYGREWLLKVSNQITHFHAEGFGNFHEGINGCGFFTAFKFSDIVVMQVSLFSQFFLTHPHILSM
jgi:hypothetical protein